MRIDLFGRLIPHTWLLVLWFSFFFQISVAQVSYESLNHQLYNFNLFPRAELGESTSSSAFRPSLNHQISGKKRLTYRSYVPVNEYDELIFTNRKYKEYSWFRRKLLYENFIIIDTGILYVTIDPLINVSRGKAEFTSDYDPAENKNTYNNTRGLLVRADIGEKFSVETYFYENQSAFPQYVDDYVQAAGVVPGQGRVKDFKKTDYDYAMSGGYFSYSPGENFNLQFGHHKHFIGYGYRSLVLSDNSFNYPFLRFNMSFLKKKLSYSVMYASFQDLNRTENDGQSEAVFFRKAGSFHHLEYNIKNVVFLGLSQSMMWRTTNTDGKKDVNYNMFNPLILANPFALGLDDINNALVAFGVRVRPHKRLEFYAQRAVDDDKFENTADQFGLKVFFAKTGFIQIERNASSNNQIYTANESSFNEQTQETEFENGFTHYNEALANTLGTGFDELIFIAAWRYKRLIPELQINFQKSVREYRTILPNDEIYIENHDQEAMWFKFELAYLLNPATNLKLFGGITYRENRVDGIQSVDKNQFINFGIKTDLRNIYYDF